MRLWYTLALCGMASTSWSLGLGPITIYSFLGEPLQASIPLHHGTEENLPSPEAMHFTVKSPAHQTPYQFLSFIEGLHTQAPRLVVRTQEPVQDPALSLEIVWNTPQLTLQRQYTLLPRLPEVIETPVEPPVETVPETQDFEQLALGGALGTITATTSWLFSPEQIWQVAEKGWPTYTPSPSTQIMQGYTVLPALAWSGALTIPFTWIVASYVAFSGFALWISYYYDRKRALILSTQSSAPLALPYYDSTQYLKVCPLKQHVLASLRW